jgi:hypothetical protein
MMGSMGASKNRVNNEIATRSPRSEQRGRIPLGSPELQQHGETATRSRMYGERLQRRTVFCTGQQSSQAMSRRIHGLKARVSKMEGKSCAFCLELEQVQQILITVTNKFTPYMPNVSHHVEVEDPQAEMVKILLPSCAHLSPNSLLDLMVRPGLQEQVSAIHKRPQAFVV